MSESERFEIVVIGSGIAAHSVVQEISKHFNRIAIIDRGNLKQSDYCFRLMKNSLRVSPSESSRRFGPGGTSSLWGGGLVPYTNLELEGKKSNGTRWWPIQTDEIQQLIPNALNFLGLSRDSKHISNSWQKEFLQVSEKTISIQKIVIGLPRPINFENKHLEYNSNVQFFEKTLCNEILRNENDDLYLNVQTLDNSVRTILAKIVVIACGGIESNRLVASSKSLRINQDEVGRHFSTHLTGIIGFLRSKRSEQLLIESRMEAYIEKEFLHISSTNISGNSAWKVNFQPLRLNLLSILTIKSGHLLLLKTYFLSVLKREEVWLINVDGDQTPSRINQVLFNPIVEIGIYMSSHDIDSLNCLKGLLKDRYLETAKISYVKRPHKNFYGQSHHLGGLPISVESTSGIVDLNLELFNEPGIFVCSSAVFPTFSSANPTLMLVQLGIRLGKYLNSRVHPTDKIFMR